MKKSYLMGLVAILIVASIGFVFLNRSEDKDNNVTVESMDKDMDQDMDKDMDKDMEKEMDEEMDKDMDSHDTTEIMNDGSAAPDFSLMSLKGEEVALNDLLGEKVYLKFWASWCSICLAGMDELNELAQAEDITVYTIVAPGEKGEKKKDAFIKWFEGLGYEHIEVLFDEDGDVQDDYSVRGFPTSVYIGSDGILVKVLPGHASNDAIYETFESIK